MDPVERGSVDTLIDELLAGHPTVGMSIGVVRSGGLDVLREHGVADLRSRRPVSEETVFRIASITKTFTAIAVLQLWERGFVDLDAPVSRYLRSFTVAFENGSPPTLRHLLTHTAGLRETAHPDGVVRPDFGESVPAGRPLPSLADFYRGALQPVAEPGSRFVYTNHAPATLGQVVEDVTGRSLADYLRENVFEPLGMADTDLVRSPEVASRLATGYEIRGRGIRPAPDREMVTVGAAAAYSTPRDMARYLAALLRGGAGEHGRVLQPESVTQMFAQQYSPDPRVPGMGLGFFRSRVAGHDVVGHQGTHPGFHSQISLVPDADVAVMLFTNGAHGADMWLPHAAATLLRAEDTSRAPSRPRAVPQRADLWDDLCGWYRLDAAPTDVRLRGMLGAGIEVFVRGGRLAARFLTVVPALARGFVMVPDDPDDPTVFRLALPDPDMEPIRLVFGTDGAGRVDHVCLDVMPLRLDKQPMRTNPRRWAAGLAAGAATAVVGRVAAAARSD